MSRILTHSSHFLIQIWFWYAIVFALHRIFLLFSIEMGPYTWLNGLCRWILLFQFELNTHTQKRVWNSRISIWMQSKFVTLQVIMLALFVRFVVVGVCQMTMTTTTTTTTGSSICWWWIGSVFVCILIIVYSTRLQFGKQLLVHTIMGDCSSQIIEEMKWKTRQKRLWQQIKKIPYSGAWRSLYK